MSILLSQRDEQTCRSSVHLPEAEAHRRFQQLAARQAGFSRVQLCEQQSSLLGPQGVLSRCLKNIASQGRQAPELYDVSESNSTERQQQVEQAVDFVLGLQQRRALVDNPFHGQSRAALCCVVFDDEGLYTLAERFAASEAMRNRDSLYFSKLIATTRNTVERRLVFTGLLEHFDALMPIEQSIYPLYYRRAQHKHLLHEEALYGRLELSRTVTELLEEHSAEWLLANVCATPSTTGAKVANVERLDNA